MAPFTMLVYFLILFIITYTEGGKKSSIDKIIIHVPYKIHKHHHTHTKYKVITIPAPKKENTVIYLKEDIQPIIQHVHPAPAKAEVVEKIIQPFIPPHQESAAALLKDLANPKEESQTQADQQHQYSTIVDDQKPLESHSGQSTEGFIPTFTFKPMVLPPQNNLIPNFSFKPFLYHQGSFTPNFMVHSDFIPKFSYPSMIHQTQRFPPFKATNPHSKDLQDSFAQMSNQVYKSVRPKVVKSYKVKEENMEDHKLSNLNRIPAPPKKMNRKGKSFLQPSYSNQFNNIIMKPDSEYEYEHVGYLIIDENSRKIVGKNFKDEIHLP